MANNIPHAETASPENIFQQRLNALLECTGATYRQIERGTGGVVNQNHVWQYRSGRARNPSYKALAALSHFFNVPASYFFGNTCDDEIAYLLPCLPKAEREHIQQMVTGLLEKQLRQFCEALPESGETITQEEAHGP